MINNLYAEPGRLRGDGQYIGLAKGMLYIPVAHLLRSTTTVTRAHL